MTDMIDATSIGGRAAGGPAGERSVQELAAELLDRAEAEGVSLVGPGGLSGGADQDGARDQRWRRS